MVRFIFEKIFLSRGSYTYIQDLWCNLCWKSYQKITKGDTCIIDTGQLSIFIHLVFETFPIEKMNYNIYIARFVSLWTLSLIFEWVLYNFFRPFGESCIRECLIIDRMRYFESLMKSDLDSVISMAILVKPQLSFVKYSKYTDGFGFVFQMEAGN